MHSLVVAEGAMRFNKLVEQGGSGRLLREFGFGMEGYGNSRLFESKRGRLEGAVGLGEGVARHVAEGIGESRRGRLARGDLVWGRIPAANILGLYRFGDSAGDWITYPSRSLEDGNKHSVIRGARMLHLQS